MAVLSNMQPTHNGISRDKDHRKALCVLTILHIKAGDIGEISLLCESIYIFIGIFNEYIVRLRFRYMPVNSEIYYIDTRQHANFHQPSVNITKYQKGAYCLGVKVYNMLPSYIKTESDNPKKFKTVLRNCLYKHSFYSLDEYFQLQKG